MRPCSPWNLNKLLVSDKRTASRQTDISLSKSVFFIFPEKPQLQSAIAQRCIRSTAFCSRRTKKQLLEDQYIFQLIMSHSSGVDFGLKYKISTRNFKEVFIPRKE